MEKFFSRLFRSKSASNNGSTRGSQLSLNDNRNRAAGNVRPSASMENLASYHVVPKDLEKNKLHKASWEGNLNKVFRLARPGQVNVKDQQSRTPLHLAVVRGHLDIVSHLVAQQARLDVIDNDQRTPLIKAVLSGGQNPTVNQHICQVLIDGDRGASINMVDKQGRSALHYAIDYGNENLVNLLLSNEHCDPNLKDYDERTPLHLAIKRNSQEMVQALLSNDHEQQADPNIVDRNGQTPLHVAASVGYVGIVRLLLASDVEEPCDPSIVDAQQLTAYQLAKNNHQDACTKLIEDYQQKWYKQTPRRQTMTSIHEQSSMRAAGSMSMNPAANQQRPSDDTSDDSSSISASKPLKTTPRRAQRSSDQWSDENGPSVSERKPEAGGLASLVKSNPLQAERPQTNQSSVLAHLSKNNPLQAERPQTNENSVLDNILTNNPLQTDSRGKPITSHQTHPSSFFGIGPVIERTGSDNTSTSVSIEKSVVVTQRTQQSKPFTSDLYTTPVRQPITSTKSWSDDTITAPAPPKQSTIKKPVSPDDTWNSSHSDDDSAAPKPKSALSTLQKTLPFAPSTNYGTHSNSDDDSVETEIRKFDTHKPVGGSTVQTLVNKQIGNGYRVVGVNEVQSPVSDDSSWTTSAPVHKEPTNKGVQNLVPKPDDFSSITSAPVHKEPNNKGVQNLVQKPDDSSWTTSAPVHKEPTNKGVQNLVQKPDDFSWTASAPVHKEPTNKGVHNLVQRPDDSSWTTSATVYKEPGNKGVHNLIQKPDDSTWDDSRPLSADLRDKQSVRNVSSLVVHQPTLPQPGTTGVENLTKMMASIMQRPTLPSTSPKVIGKLLVSPMIARPESVLSENTSHAVDDDDDDEQSWKRKSEEWSVTAPIGQDFKTLQHLARPTLPAERASLHESVSSTKSSIYDINELKENIKRLERQQDDALELRRQLKEMENKKNEFEKRYRENDQMLRDVEVKLELERTEKQRLESTTKDLNIEMKNIRQRLQFLQEEKESLNQRFLNLQEERDNHETKVRKLEATRSPSTSSSSTEDEDPKTIESRRREEMKSLSAANDDLRHRTQQFESDVQRHKESVDMAKRYQMELEKALQDNHFFQQELDRVKHEKQFVEQEKLEYKSKYDGLQEEIRMILFDRSKLEQTLTGELQEHIQRKQRSTDDIKKYRTETEQLNIKLADAEARLLTLQTQNQALIASKDRQLKDEFELLAQRLNQSESEQIDASQRYQSQQQELTRAHHPANESLSALVATPLTQSVQRPRTANHSIAAITSTPLTQGAQHQRSTHDSFSSSTPPTHGAEHRHHGISSLCTNCHTLQRSYDQERASRLQIEQDNIRLRDTLSRKEPYQHLSRTFPQPPHNENHLVTSSRQMRSDTERVKSELDRLRQEFDQLVANYEPTDHSRHQAQLHSQIDTFRQFYEHEFRQRQLATSQITAGVKPPRTIVYHQSDRPIYHDHMHNGGASCSACVNSRLLKERLATAIDSNLSEQRMRTIQQTVPLPRQASALLTINTTHKGLTSSVEIIRPKPDV